MIDLDDLTELENDTLFEFEKLPTRPNFEKNSPLAISVEMNLDINAITRQTYTVLDYLSDIGGI